MIKTSILARKLDFASMGDLRDDIVADIERLEAIEDAFVAIRRECEKADEPTVNVVTVDCEIEWAIYGTSGNMWLYFHGGEYGWRAEPFHAKRWGMRNGAQSYINTRKIANAIPFPVPKIKEAK